MRNAAVLLLAVGALAQVNVASVVEDEFVGHNDTIVPKRYIIEIDAVSLF